MKGVSPGSTPFPWVPRENKTSLIPGTARASDLKASETDETLHGGFGQVVLGRSLSLNLPRVHPLTLSDSSDPRGMPRGSACRSAAPSRRSPPGTPSSPPAVSLRVPPRSAEPVHIALVMSSLSPAARSRYLL
jgi:hypothetical protein